MGEQNVSFCDLHKCINPFFYHLCGDSWYPCVASDLTKGMLSN